MSTPSRLWKLLKAKREHNTITLELQDENGNFESLTLGVGSDPHSTHRYVVKHFGRDVSGTEPDNELSFYVIGPSGKTYVIEAVSDDADDVWERLVSRPKLDAARLEVLRLAA